jgi:hypothetical protein
MSVRAILFEEHRPPFAELDDLGWRPAKMVRVRRGHALQADRHCADARPKLDVELSASDMAVADAVAHFDFDGLRNPKRGPLSSQIHARLPSTHRARSERLRGRRGPEPETASRHMFLTYVNNVAPEWTVKRDLAA